MSRIAERFATLELRDRKGFIPFVTAGDPDLNTSLAIVLKLAEMGADVIELGVPFSDPMADGPVIQRSSQRALMKGTTLSDVIYLAADVRRHCDVPIILFSYYNPILSYGFDGFCQAAASAGVDGLLVTDMIDDEAVEIADRLSGHGLDLISLVAPTTTDDRLAAICANARGFIYAVSRAGVTGERDSVSSAAQILVERARQFTDLPVAVGFGISTRTQVAEVWNYADAAVVGSAIVATIERAGSAENPVSAVESLIRDLLPEFAKTERQN